ncbi:unnamed protein product, partial [Choristocarpus tenellus]
DYDQLLRIKKSFEPYSNLWTTAQNWFQSYNASRFFDNNGKVGQSNIANFVKDRVNEFKPKVPIIVALRNPGMKPRHWKALSEKVSKVFIP